MSKSKLQAFKENGQKIAAIRDELIQEIQTTQNLQKIELLAQKRIKEAGGEPAFMKVSGYKWATCISVNDCIVHGIPVGTVKKGDVVTIDIGMYYKGTTTDTASTAVIGSSTKEIQDFLDTGKRALKKAIKMAIPGNTIKDISKAMQQTVEAKGYNVSRDLIGHGLGETIHQDPPIPCYVSDDPRQSTRITPGMVLAIEIMYMMGDWHLYTKKDGWGMHTKDGSLAAQFEHDVIITQTGNHLITA